MKLLSVIAFVVFGFVHASHAAQLVIKEETGASLFVYLKEVGGSAKAHPPIENYEEWDKGVARWKDLREGKYRLCLGQTHGSFANYCIVVSDLTISKGANSLSIRLPSYDTLNVEVKLQNVAPPRKPETSYAYWFRVDRINKDGHLDPDYRQWLSTHLKDGIYTGSLSHLTPGTYRISAFHSDENAERGSDIGCGLLVVTDEALEKKKTETIVIKPVEHAGTGQTATRPVSKPEGNQKPQPKSKGRSRRRVARPLTADSKMKDFTGHVTLVGSDYTVESLADELCKQINGTWTIDKGKGYFLTFRHPGDTHGTVFSHDPSNGF